MLKKIGTVIEKITGAVSAISYVGIVAIVLLNVLDVFLTKAFSSPILGSYEITEQLLLITVYASFAYGQSKKSHINMALIIARLPRTLRYICFALMCALSVGVAGLMGYSAVMQGLKNLASGVVTSNLYIPTYPFVFLVGLSMFVFAIALLYDMVLSLVAIKDDEIAEYVASGWST